VSTNFKASDKKVDVISRLSLLGISIDQVREIALRAITAKYNAVSNHPQNAGGMLAYIEGVKTLRDELGKDSDWEVSRPNNMETIRNSITKIEFAYSNVDYACREEHNPQPISKKGKASKKAVNNNQLPLFEDNCDSSPVGNYQLWYVLVSEKNGHINAEVSLPTSMEDGCFTMFKERIFCVINATSDEIGDLYDMFTDEVEYDDEITISKK